MTRRDFWLGVLAIVLAVSLHAIFPRYEWRGTPVPRVRIDHWTGRSEVGRYYAGRWISPDLEQRWREDGARRQKRVPLSELEPAEPGR